MTKQSTREGFLGNFRWGSVLRRAAFGGDEPWDTFMSNLRSIPLIIDTEVKVGLSFQRGGTVEKKVGARHRFSARFSTWSRDTTRPPFSISRIIEQTRFPTDEVEKYERIHWLCFQQTKAMLFLKQNSLGKLT